MAYLTLEELCKELNIKADRTTAWRWRKQGMPSIKIGNQIRYDKEKVIKWLEGKEQ
jgi:excisionase family DNA binding protein